jgi:hypothetical protein
MPRGLTDFLPSTSGLKFANSFPDGVPVLRLPIPWLGVSIPIGDASHGVCGGMVYAALDLFLAQPRLEAPPDRLPPPAGSPVTQFVLQRLLDSFTLERVTRSNAMRYLDFMSVVDHDTWFSRGVGWIVANREWPAIRRDIDQGRPVPLGLVAGSWVWATDLGAKSKMLGHCHQVLAYGYDLDDAMNLLLRVYDPNDPEDDDSRIETNLANPSRGLTILTPRITANIEGHQSFRAFFRHTGYAPVVPPVGVSPGPVEPGPQAPETEPSSVPEGSPL